MKPASFCAGILLAPLLLTACTVDTANCDPNAVGNVLTSAACSQQGVFDQRRANLSGNLNTLLAEVERERIAISRANTRIRELQAQQRLTAAQSQTLNREIAALNGDVNRLSASSNNPSQAAALRSQIAQRKAAINSYATVAVF